MQCVAAIVPAGFDLGLLGIGVAIICVSLLIVRFKLLPTKYCDLRGSLFERRLFLLPLLTIGSVLFILADDIVSGNVLGVAIQSGIFIAAISIFLFVFRPRN